jgi:hypothetical protein
MGRPNKPIDVVMQNGWYLEFAGVQSPHFQTLEGLSKKTGLTELVDAGTNIKYKFIDQIKDFGSITLSRALDLSRDDKAFKLLTDASIDTGFKHIGNLVKLHHGKEVFRVILVGVLFNEYNYPSLDVNGTSQFNVSVAAAIDEILGL